MLLCGCKCSLVDLRIKLNAKITFVGNVFRELTDSGMLLHLVGTGGVWWETSCT